MNVKEILLKAVNCDKHGRRIEAYNHYLDGVEMLMALVEDEEDNTKRQMYHARIKEYINRADAIRERMRSAISNGELVASIAIDEDSTGNSYKSLFGKILNGNIEEVQVEESYLQEYFQFQNLVMLLELLCKICKNLKYIKIITKTDPKNPDKQLSTLEKIQNDIIKRDIGFTLKFDDSLHDRKIILGNNYVIKIGRGLHFFKPCAPMTLGMFDYDFRKCLKTDVDIWRTKECL